ncbi:hypothetical protein JAAARDRAFT_517134 [Jaapia argillacea MUCL 33604]|uniref:ADF-H domain-containing protein n=1 Tax=Jaapia argillacea MUCL 33604 TaxID=933084 RepID=A0A067Q3S5_9AGAM|nr:hypothetical protein JAAARDRAFT_517134 [Jaapia argillacea MUCL 33604]
MYLHRSNSHSSFLHSMDPKINHAYKLVLNDRLRWFLFSTTDESYRLYSTGNSGIDELKEKVTQDEVYYGCLREKWQGKPRQILIAYIPSSLPGATRAQALDRARELCQQFKIHHGFIKAEETNELSSQALTSILRMGGCQECGQILRSMSEQSESHKPLPQPPLIRRTMTLSESMAPPLPPKDGDPLKNPNDPLFPRYAQSSSISAAQSRDKNAFVDDPREHVASRGYSRTNTESLTGEEMAEQEARRQHRLKQEKVASMQEYVLAEERRKAMLAQTLLEVANKRREREHEEAEAEKRHQIEVEAKRKADRERWIEKSEEAERWRLEQVKKAEAIAQGKEQDRKSRVEARQTKVRDILATSRAQGKDFLHSCWISVQKSDSVTWRRRYLVLDWNGLRLYRSGNDMTQPLETVFHQKLRGVKEWDEGYEELRSVTHSFAIEFLGEEAWRMYTESEADKVSTYTPLDNLRLRGWRRISW